MTTSTATMSTSASGSAAGYIALMIISIIYMLITFGSHIHISAVTNMLIIFFWIKLPLKLPKFLTIQKCDTHFSVTGFAQMLKPNTFEGAHYKRWRQRCILWFTSMHCFFVVEPRPLGIHTAEDEQRFIDADTTFKGAMISVLEDSQWIHT